MKLTRTIFALAGLSALVAVAPVAATQLLSRPASGKGPEAKTLVVHSDVRTPFSLADDLTSLKMQLARIATRLESAPVSKVTSNQLADADYLVVFCPQPFPTLSQEFLQAVADAKQPVLWIGYGADELETRSPFTGQFKISAYAVGKIANTVNYRGRNWNAPVSSWLPVELTSNPIAQVIMTLPDEAKGETVQRPIVWRTGSITFFTALPTPGSFGFLFSDLLLDFFGVKETSPPALFVRIDGYHCQRDHSEFRRLVDYLYDRGHPFILGVIPAYWDPVEGKVLELDSQPEFVAALRYAQQRGGRLVMQGYIHAHKGRTGEEPEFWDADADRPLAENGAQYVRERVHQGLRQMLKQGLLPLAWETPHYAATHIDYGEIANHFSTAVERVQLSDATTRETFVGSACTVDEFERFIVPENCGFVSEQTNSMSRVVERASLLTQLRGTVVSCSFPAYLPLEKIVELNRALERLKVPFLDLAEGDHWVQLPEAILLTGNGQRSATLRDARIKWKAFDRGGKLLREELEPKTSSGERIFKRRGIGDYELFEIVEAKP